MALAYILKKYKDVYTIENTGAVALTYTLSKGECGGYSQVNSGSISPSSVITLPIKYIDGKYQVAISDNVSTETLPDILFYNNFLLYIIDKINALYCNCNGGNRSCRDCDGIDCNSYLNLLSSTNAYLMLNYEPYQNALKDISDAMHCDIDNIVLEFTSRTQITGNEEILEILDQIIASHYMSFYLYEISVSIDESERDYIKNKYKISSISKCFKKIGIDIEDITETIIANSPFSLFF